MADNLRTDLVVLLAEDSPGDQRLTREALVDAGVPHELHCVEDGAAALEFLRGEGEYAGAPRPDLVLLDLRMPGVGGQQVLQEISRDPALQGLRVVVQTTSDSDVDMVMAWELGAMHYVAKPVTAEKITTLLDDRTPDGETAPGLTW